MSKYVFIGKSSHPKAKEVFRRLVENAYLTGGNCTVFSDCRKGLIDKIANDANIVVVETPTNKAMLSVLETLNPDFIISCGWHKKISKKVIQKAGVCAINCHSSFLPDYKGLGAYKHAWSNAEAFSGATVHIMEEDFDSGNILAQSKVKIYFWDTPKTILYRISEQTALLIQIALLKLEQGQHGIPQLRGEGRYFYSISNIKHVLYRLYNVVAKLLYLRTKTTKFK